MSTQPLSATSTQANLKKSKAGVQGKTSFRRTGIALAMGLALAGMNAAYAAPGKICLDGVSPAFDPVTNAPCAAGVIGTYYANSPILKKFVDTLPGLTPAGANKFANGKPGEYIPIAVADTTTYKGSEYFVIGVIEHDQQMHSDLPKATTLRSYVQLYPKLSERPAALGTTNPPTAAVDSLTGQILPAPVALTYPNGSPITWPGTTEQVYGYDKPHYLGPIILTFTGTPVRVKMVNFLPTGPATTTGGVFSRNGDFFLPVDESLQSAGETPTQSVKYTQNRVAFHLHGGDNPWVSDGTPHQWIAPADDPTPFKKGASLVNIPDMPFPGEGSQTIFWPNDQSSRLMWYHDHTNGLTRQNAYAGEAAGYVILDAAELALLNGGTVNGVSINKAIPNGLLDQIVLVVQDKGFVPNDVAMQDSKWDVTAWGKPGDLWYPHVYEPNQIWSINGSVATTDGQQVKLNPAGRWDYATDEFGAYLPPNVPLRADPDYGDVAFPDGSYQGGPSATPESYMDTPMVNGIAYPTMTVDPKAYRIRFLAGANDRYFNLSLWVADDTPSVVAAAGRPGTEIRMVPADGKAYTFTPAGTSTPVSVTVPNDGRIGGVPDPTTAGPNIIQFGNESGLLPAPVVYSPKPIGGFVDAAGAFIEQRDGAGRDFYLGDAERADTVIDFSQYAGKTLILYNDSSAPVPGGDPRYDYYTGNPDLTTTGGAPTTLPGYGPNTRTVMQIVVNPLPAGATPVAPYDPTGTGGALATELPKAYAATADVHPVSGVDFATASVDMTANTLTVAAGTTPLPLTVKTIQGFTDPNFGRLIAQLGVELQSSPGVGTPLAYIDNATDVINAGETQYWLIKNNDGDNHPMHFHLFNVQLLARVDQATQALIAPEPSELGWKETIKNWPGEDIIVAVRPKTPQLPFGLPNSVRYMDPSMAPNAATVSGFYRPGEKLTTAFAQFDLVTGAPLSSPVVNTVQNFGWEYVWHCHILGHEENDLMRPLVFNPVIKAPAVPTGIAVSSAGLVTWTDPTPSGVSGTKGNAANEIGFRVERAAFTNGVAGVWTPVSTTGSFVAPNVNTLANATSLQDLPAATTDYQYRVVTVNAVGETPSAAVKLSHAPAAPTNLTASFPTTTLTTVKLAWTDNATNETGYVVKRATGTIAKATGAVTWGIAAALPKATSVQPANTVAYTDGPTGVTANTLYQYQVYAQNGTLVGTAATLNLATATTLAAPTQMQAKGSATTTTLGIQWQASTSALATGYEIQRCVGTSTTCAAGTAVWTTAGTVAGGSTQTFADSGLTTKTSYTYRVRATNSVVSTLVSPSSAMLTLKTK